nr:hypothetical protein [Tanacetum cinerariifolium]
TIVAGLCWGEVGKVIGSRGSTPFETRHPFQTIHIRKRNDSNQTRGRLNKKLKRGVTFKRKVVVTKGQKGVEKGIQKSVEKGEQKVSESEAALGKKKKKKKAMEKGKWIMVEEDVRFNKKKPILPRPTSIVIR